MKKENLPIRCYVAYNPIAMCLCKSYLELASCHLDAITTKLIYNVTGSRVQEWHEVAIAIARLKKPVFTSPAETRRLQTNLNLTP